MEVFGLSPVLAGELCCVPEVEAAQGVAVLRGRADHAKMLAAVLGMAALLVRASPELEVIRIDLLVPLGAGNIPKRIVRFRPSAYW